MSSRLRPVVLRCCGRAGTRGSCSGMCSLLLRIALEDVAATAALVCSVGSVQQTDAWMHFGVSGPRSTSSGGCLRADRLAIIDATSSLRYSDSLRSAGSLLCGGWNMFDVRSGLLAGNCILSAACLGVRRIGAFGWVSWRGVKNGT